jgi:hypothetical protein
MQKPNALLPMLVASVALTQMLRDFSAVPVMPHHHSS